MQDLNHKAEFEEQNRTVRLRDSDLYIYVYHINFSESRTSCFLLHPLEQMCRDQRFASPLSSLCILLFIKLLPVAQRNGILGTLTSTSDPPVCVKAEIITV